MTIQDLENHMVLPHADPDDDLPNREIDEDEAYERARQAEIDDAGHEKIFVRDERARLRARLRLAIRHQTYHSYYDHADMLQLLKDALRAIEPAETPKEQAE